MGMVAINQYGSVWMRDTRPWKYEVYEEVGGGLWVFFGYMSL